MSTIWTLVFGLELSTALILSTVLVLGFTVLGGLPGTIITDALQAVLIIAGIIILAVACLNFAGGISQVIAGTPAAYLSAAGPYGAKETFLFFLSVGSVLSGLAVLLAAHFRGQVRIRVAAGQYSGRGDLRLCFCLPDPDRPCGRLFLPPDTNPDMIFSIVTLQLLPPQIGGLSTAPCWRPWSPVQILSFFRAAPT